MAPRDKTRRWRSLLPCLSLGALGSLASLASDYSREMPGPTGSFPWCGTLAPQCWQGQGGNMEGERLAALLLHW